MHPNHRQPCYRLLCPSQSHPDEIYQGIEQDLETLIQRYPAVVGHGDVRQLKADMNAFVEIPSHKPRSVAIQKQHRIGGVVYLRSQVRVRADGMNNQSRSMATTAVGGSTQNGSSQHARLPRGRGGTIAGFSGGNAGAPPQGNITHGSTPVNARIPCARRRCLQ